MSKIAVTRALRLSGTCIDITKIFAYARLCLGRAVDAFTITNCDQVSAVGVGRVIQGHDASRLWLGPVSAIQANSDQAQLSPVFCTKCLCCDWL